MTDPLRLAAAALEFVAHSAHRDSNTVTSLALISIGVACGAGGGGFAIAALLIYLIPLLGAAAAGLVVAGVLVTVALSAFAVNHHLSHRRARLPVNGRPAQQLDLESLAAGAEGFVRDNKALALSAAFVAGLLTAEERVKSR